MKQVELFVDDIPKDDLLFGWSKINKDHLFTEYYSKIKVAQKPIGSTNV